MSEYIKAKNLEVGDRFDLDGVLWTVSQVDAGRQHLLLYDKHCDCWQVDFGTLDAVFYLKREGGGG